MVQDLLFSRYSGAYKEVYEMCFEDAIELINYANKEKREEFIRLRWINGYQSQVSLDEFRDVIGSNKPQEENKDVVDILKDLKDVFG